jgi:hypothetical protein
MGRLLRSKLAALTPGLAWMVPTLVLSAERPEGDLVIAANAPGYVYIFGGTAVVLLAVLLAPSAGGSWLLRPTPSRIPAKPTI